MKREEANDKFASKLAYNPEVGVRDYTAFISQLKGVIEDARAEPPEGVGTNEVEHRIALLQSALDEVERRNLEIHRCTEVMRYKRVLGVHRRRTQAEDEANTKLAQQEKQRLRILREMREEQQQYYRHKNEKKEEKADLCRIHNATQHRLVSDRAASNEERRKRNLENLEKARQHYVETLRQQEFERQKKCRETNERRAAQLERERMIKQEQSALHDAEIALKLSSVRESRQAKQRALHAATEARLLAVRRQEEALVEARAAAQAQFVSSLKDKHRQQELRYQNEKDTRDFYQQQRAALREKRHAQQKDVYVRLLTQRLKKGEEIVEEAKKKKKRGEIAKEKQATQFIEAGQTLREEVSQHRERAMQLEADDRNQTLLKNYKRWNCRAARIIQEIRDAIQTEEEALAESAAQTAKGKIGANRDQELVLIHPKDAAEACLRYIPSPDLFSVPDA